MGIILQDSTKAGSKYHHGNLKQALVDAYIELLGNEPAEKLSLRRVAKQVGVAPTAVYNHFVDKQQLIVAVKMRCLRQFTKYLNVHSNHAVEPEDRIRSLGIAYFKFSIEHAQLFEVIVNCDIPEEYVTDEVMETSMAAEAELRSAITALCVKHGIPASLYNEGLGAFACWSMAHGITGLAKHHLNRAACLSGRWPPEFLLQDEKTVEQSFSAMTNVLVAGLLSEARRTLDS
ncbi:TetR family transcriptional regulator [Alteromonadaceae bacterium 2753L.S.0a.02]|nr:TetR family transcriptional regulator [Alteromonadaceae bacterium 2753L.S.0a.02]